MSILFSWWWLGLPLLALPIWWHRQRRQQKTAKSLATARFLDQTDPRLQTVWRWRQLILLALRLLMLLCLLALVAGIFYRGRGDTIFISQHADKNWVQQQLSQLENEPGSNWSAAAIESICAEASCSIQTDHILSWLALHQHEWKSGSRWLVLASAKDGQMSANVPKFAHVLELRVAPKTTPATLPPLTIPVVVKSARFSDWQAWFTAFEQTLDGQLRFDVREQWNKNAPASLIIWESSLPPIMEWQAPLWWVSEASAFPTVSKDAKEAIVLSELDLRVFDSAQGRVWLKSAKADWPLYDMEGAKRLFETWRSLQSLPQGFAMQTISVPASPDVISSASEMPLDKKANLDSYWILALLILFCLERSVNHARRA